MTGSVGMGAASWLLAIAPILLLIGLVLRSRLSTGTIGVLTVGVAIVVGGTWFGSGFDVLGVALVKGVWTGIWILYVVWPALLLYHLAASAGLTEAGPVFSSILGSHERSVLVVAWVLPSFIQGVAGFGTPIAVAGPLLLAMGLHPVMAVALPLVGYQWSVTFGSMGSSFYMAGLTANLPSAQMGAFASDAALILGVNAVLSGLLVAYLLGGMQTVRHTLPMVGAVGTAMASGLFLAAQVEPSVATLTAGAAGLLTVVVMRQFERRPVPSYAMVGTADSPAIHDFGAESSGPGTATGQRGVVALLLPYAYLLVLVLAVFLPPASRAFVKGHALVGPRLPTTVNGLGATNEAVAVYNPIALLGHPGTYILLAALTGYVTYRVAGVWPRGEEAATLRRWLRQASRSSLSVISLAAVATVMVDTGMVRVIADAAASLAGAAYPAVAPLVGATGSFTTGSTTSSNALFAALQSEVAELIGVGPSELLAAQTAGGNVGNSLAPVVVLIGATAVGAEQRVGAIIRRTAIPALVLLASVIGLTYGLILVR